MGSKILGINELETFNREHSEIYLIEVMNHIKNMRQLSCVEYSVLIFFNWPLPCYKLSILLQNYPFKINHAILKFPVYANMLFDILYWFFFWG